MSECPDYMSIDSWMGRESPRSPAQQPSGTNTRSGAPGNTSQDRDNRQGQSGTSTLDRDSLISLDSDSVRVRTLDGDLLEPDSWNPQPPSQATNSPVRPTNRPLKRSGGERKASWDDNNYMEDGGRLKPSGGQRSHDSGGQRSHESGGGHRRASEEDILVQSSRRTRHSPAMQTLGSASGGAACLILGSGNSSGSGNYSNKQLRRSGEFPRSRGSGDMRASGAAGVGSSSAWVELTAASAMGHQQQPREEAWSKHQTRGGHRTLDSMPRRRSLEDNGRRLVDPTQFDHNRITVRSSKEEKSHSMDASGSSNSEAVNTIQDGDTNNGVGGLTVSFTAGSSDQPNQDSSTEAVNSTKSETEKPRNVKALLEKLSDFLSETNLEHQIEEERKEIHTNIELKNEEILQKRENHRHKLNEIHDGYKREIQKENERHVEDLKVTERDIDKYRRQLQELEELNINISRKIPCNKSSSFPDVENLRVRELLECPVCMEEMRPPKKIFQCSNGHVICELCKNNPGVRTCPTCRVEFRSHTVVRNIVAEKLARSTYNSSDSEENLMRPSHTRESNISEYSDSTPDDFPTDFPSGLFLANDDEDDTVEDYYRARSLLYNRGNRNNNRRRNRFFSPLFTP